MHDFLELIVELIFEVAGEVTMESKRLKNWVKTTLFSVLGGLIVLMFAWITVSCAIDGESWQTATMSALTVLMLAFVIWGAIRGHKRKWKND